MAIKERYQSVTLGDTINLDFYSYNNNALEDLYAIQRVEVYFLDPTQKNDTNPDGKRIKLSIDSALISHISTGHYRAQVTLNDNLFEIGDYVDVWKVKFNDFDTKYTNVEQQFKISLGSSNTSPVPFVYDVSFSFSPKKMMKYEKKYMKIGFIPQLHSDIGNKTISQELLEQFYYALKSTDGLYIRIELMEGCNYNSDSPYANVITDPEWDTVEIRGDNEAYYQIDATEDGDYGLGIYYVQLKAEIGEQTIISPKFMFQVMD